MTVDPFWTPPFSRPAGVHARRPKQTLVLPESTTCILRMDADKTDTTGVAGPTRIKKGIVVAEADDKSVWSAVRIASRRGLVSRIIECGKSRGIAEKTGKHAKEGNSGCAGKLRPLALSPPVKRAPATSRPTTDRCQKSGGSPVGSWPKAIPWWISAKLRPIQILGQIR